MPVYKNKEKTADGRQYYYKLNYTDAYGKHHQIKSKLFASKKDAEKQEAIKRLELDKLATDTLTFNQVAAVFLKEKKAS